MAITEHALINAVVKIGQQIASAIFSFEEISSIVADLQYQLYSICSDIRGSQLESATSSIRNAQIVNSNTLKIDELNKALVHLEDAYFLTKTLLNKKYVRTSTFLFFFTDTEEVDAIPWRYRKDWIAGQIEICSILTLIYRYKQSKELEAKWHATTISLYNDYAHQYLELSAEQLEDINRDFVYHTTRIEWETVEYNEFFSKAEKNEIDEIHVTAAGEKYRESHMMKMISNFEMGLADARIL